MICNDDQHHTPLPQSGMLSTRRVAPPTVVVSGDQMMGMDGGASSSAVNLDTYLHALRRNWFWCLLLGTIFAGAAGATVWKLVQDRYTAFAELRAHSAPQDLLGDGNGRQREKFETYISSVKQLLKSRKVIAAALRSPDLKECSLVAQEKDPEGWLAGALGISNPKDSEILIVSLTAHDPSAAADVVNAVVNTYLSSVEIKERQTLVEKKDKLEGMHKKLVAQEQRERDKLQEMAEVQGTVDASEMSFKHQIEMEQARHIQGQLINAMVQLKQAEADLKLEQLRLEKLEKEAVIPDDELGVMLAMDPEGRLLVDELNYLAHSVDQAGAMSSNVNGSGMAGLGHVRARIRDLQADLKTLGDTLALKWKIEQRKKLQTAIDEKESRTAILATQKAEWEREFAKYSNAVESIGKKFVNVELQRKDIERIGKKIDNVAAAIARTELQLESKGRMERISEARTPVTANKPGKKMMAAAAGLFAFVLPTVGLLFWDVRSQLVNTADEVTERLGLPIMGSVPILPSRVTRRLGGPSSRGRWWQALLSESIAGIRANLLRQDDVRVVMVTSAVGGEGKTTVATQLAMSLARAGKRTALVDFDLPRPSVSSVFNIELEPGVCDILRGECDIDDVVNDTVLPNLFVIPAGVADGVSTQAMNSLELPELLHDLRSQFEYVIVDGSPLVPVADARVVSRYVDGAICCVLRDVSRLSMIRRASEILDTFGVHLLGTVVTARQETYYMSRNMKEETLV